MNKQQLIEKAVLLFDGKWIFPFKNLCTPAETNTCYAPHSKFESILNVSELGPNWIFVCTEEEFNAAADRMRGKPDWKDAPEWAESLAQDESGYWWFYDSEAALGGDAFINSAGGRSKKAGVGRCLGDWRNTLEKRPEQKVETVGDKSWVDLGILPPPGTMVEIVGEGLVYGHGETGEVVGCFVPPEGKCLNSVAIVNMSYGMGCFSRANLKPIKTGKEKAIEAAIEAMQPNSLTGTMALWFGKLYDAGLLRLPDQK